MKLNQSFIALLSHLLLLTNPTNPTASQCEENKKGGNSSSSFIEEIVVEAEGGIKGIRLLDSLKRRVASSRVVGKNEVEDGRVRDALLSSLRERVTDIVTNEVEDRGIQLILNRRDSSAIVSLFDTASSDSTSMISQETRSIVNRIDNLFTTFLIFQGTENLLSEKRFTSANYTNFVVDEDGRFTLDENGNKIDKFNLGWYRNEEREWEKGFIPSDIVEVSNGLQVKRIRDDEFYGSGDGAGIGGIASNLIGYLLKDQNVFPLEDANFSFDQGTTQMSNLIRDTKLVGRSQDGAAPDPYEEHVWDGEKSSDENFSRFFFHGIGAALLEQQGEEKSSRPYLGPIEIDIDFMKNLKVREGFRRMGAKIYFNANQTVTGIYDSFHGSMVFPHDEKERWEGAKFLARSSAFTLLTAREHLYQTHLMCSNYFSLASIKHLPPNHPLRRLVNVFTFRTNKVNDNAFASLVPEFSTLHRSVGFEYDSMRTIFESSFANSNIWEPFPDRKMHPELLKMSRDNKLPYHSEAIEYYNIVNKFIRSWLEMDGYDYGEECLGYCTRRFAGEDEYAEAFYNEIRDSSIGQKYTLPEFEGAESTVQLMTQAIFMVTCYHEILGTIIDYTIDPEFVAMRVREGNSDGSPSTEADVQTFIQFLMVTASTALEVPMLMEPYENYFGVDGYPRWERTLWDSFLSDLEKHSTDLEGREREVQFLFFNPRKFESAVSV